MTPNELVVLQLQNYAEGRRELQKMKDLLASHRVDETAEETIEAMTFPSMQEEEHTQSAWHSDPTSRIAKLYRRVNLATNRAARDELANAILETEEGLDQLKDCVEALPDRSRRILELLYFEEKTWEDTAVIESIAIQTLSYHRKRGIKKIAAMLPYRMLSYESA